MGWILTSRGEVWYYVGETITSNDWHCKGKLKEGISEYTCVIGSSVYLYDKINRLKNYLDIQMCPTMIHCQTNGQNF